MKKFVPIVILTILVLSMAAFPSYAAVKDGDVLYFEDFENTTADFSDPNLSYDAEVENGKLKLFNLKGSTLYRLPNSSIKGIDQFTIVYDWEELATMAPTNPGHTLYALFGIKDNEESAIYAGVSIVNGTEHEGTIVNGRWFRQFRDHYYDEECTLQSTRQTLDTENNPKIRIKIEVDKGVTRSYVNGKRYVPTEGEGWRDHDQLQELWWEGGIGFATRGLNFVAAVDNVWVYAGIGLTSIEDFPMQDAAETTVPETTAPETTVPETTEPETTEPETTPETTEPETTPVLETTPEKPKKGGCGSDAGFALIVPALFIPALIRRKKRK